eukprot:7171301-Pyramimonas_sp.AAC.4
MADDTLLTLAWNKIGEYYSDRQKWAKAVAYYAQAKNTEQCPNRWRAQSLGRELDSPVVEWLDKGLIAVWSSNRWRAQSLGGELNSPVVEWLDKG